MAPGQIVHRNSSVTVFMGRKLHASGKRRLLRSREKIVDTPDFGGMVIPALRD